MKMYVPSPSVQYVRVQLNSREYDVCERKFNGGSVGKCRKAARFRRVRYEVPSNNALEHSEEPEIRNFGSHRTQSARFCSIYCNNTCEWAKNMAQRIKKLSRKHMKGMNVALIISTFSLASILFPPTLKRISVDHMQSIEGKWNSDFFLCSECWVSKSHICFKICDYEQRYDVQFVAGFSTYN